MEDLLTLVGLDDATLRAIQASAVAEALKYSRWSYATANALHILGIALLIGSVVPLNLKLLGAWPDRPLPEVARITVPVAATGLSLAILAGIAIFTVRARYYVTVEFLYAKIALVLIGLTSALIFHFAAGRWLERAGPTQRRVHALVSLTCWIAALFCGRYIAYAR